MVKIEKKEIIFIPVKDSNGNITAQMRVIVGSALHKLLLSVNGKLPLWIEK